MIIDAGINDLPVGEQPDAPKPAMLEACHYVIAIQAAYQSKCPAMPCATRSSTFPPCGHRSLGLLGEFATRFPAHAITFGSDRTYWAAFAGL